MKEMISSLDVRFEERAMNRISFSVLVLLAVVVCLPGCSENSSGSYNIPIISLEAPTDLRAAGKSSTLVQLRWEDNADEEDGYYIERSTDGADFEIVGWPVAVR